MTLTDHDLIARLAPVPSAAAAFLRRTPAPRRTIFGSGVHTGALDVLLRCAADRGSAFVVFQLLSPFLPGSNDVRLDTVEDVRDVLDRFVVSESELEYAFGPNFRAVTSHAFRVSDLLHDNGTAKVPTATDSHRRLGAWLHAREIAWEFGRVDQWYRAQAAAWEPRYVDTSPLRIEDPAAREVVLAVRDVAAALSVGDLVGHGLFSQNDFDILTAPWRQVSEAVATCR